MQQLIGRSMAEKIYEGSDNKCCLILNKMDQMKLDLVLENVLMFIILLRTFGTPTTFRSAFLWLLCIAT